MGSHCRHPVCFGTHHPGCCLDAIKTVTKLIFFMPERVLTEMRKLRGCNYAVVLQSPGRICSIPHGARASQTSPITLCPRLLLLRGEMFHHHNFVEKKMQTGGKHMQQSPKGISQRSTACLLPAMRGSSELGTILLPMKSWVLRREEGVRQQLHGKTGRLLKVWAGLLHFQI